MDICTKKVDFRYFAGSQQLWLYYFWISYQLKAVIENDMIFIDYFPILKVYNRIYIEQQGDY